MAVSHVFSSPVVDMTGTVTVFDSNGNTATTNATVLVRPSNWNSAHNQFMTISGNTAGASTASGTNLILQGGNKVTLSVTDQTIIFSASDQTVQTQSNVQGISAGTQVGRTGDILFADSNGISFGMSGSSRVTASYTVPTQTNQTIGVYGSSNTTGESSSSTVDARSLTFLGKGAVSVGLSAGQVVISGPSGGAAFSAGISGGNTAGDTGTVSNQIVFAGGNNVTVSGSTNAGGMSVTISGANAGGAQTGISGIVVSDTTYTSGTVSFSNAGNITISSSVNGATQYIRLSGNPAQTNVAFSADASSTFQTLTFQNSNNVSFSNNAGAIRVTHNLAGTSTGSAGANVGISMTHNSSGLNLSITVPAQTNQTLSAVVTGNTTGNTSGLTVDARSLTLQGLGIASMGISTSAGGSSIIVSATQSNQAFSAGAASSTFQTLSFQDSNGLSFSNNAGAIRVSYTRNVASNAIQSVGSATGSGTNTSRFAADDHVHAGVFSMGVSTGGNTAGDTRVDVGRFVLVGGNNITLSQATAANALNTISIVGGAGGGGFTGGMSNIGNTAGTSGTVQSQMLVVGGPNITVSQSINGQSATLSISGNAPGAAAENNWFTLTGDAAGNVVGNSSASGSTIMLSARNLTLSGTNNSQIMISAPATSSLVGASGISVSTNGSTISVIPNYASYFAYPVPNMDHATIAQFVQSNTSYVNPIEFHDLEAFSFVMIPASVSMASMASIATAANNTKSYNQEATFNFVLYSRGTGASSQSLQSVASTSNSSRMSINVGQNANGSQWTVTHGFTFPASNGTTSTSASYATSLTNVNISTTHLTFMTGMKKMAFPWTSSISNNQYWLMYGVQTAATTSGNASLSNMRITQSNWYFSGANNAWGEFGSAANNSIQAMYGLGSYSNAATGTTASLGLSDISSSASHPIMFMTFARIA